MAEPSSTEIEHHPRQETECQSSGSRRRFLRVVGGVGIAGIAGCVRQSAPADADRPIGDGGANAPTNRDWPSYGFDHRNTGHDPAGVGPTTPVGIDWAFDTGGPSLYASPVVADGTVYTGSMADRGEGILFALDAESGEEQWRFPTQEYVASAPVIDGEAVYVGDEKLYAIDAADGTERWRLGFDGKVRAAPTVVDDTVYVGTTGETHTVEDGPPYTRRPSHVLAVDAGTGEEQWRFEHEDWVLTAPAIVDDTLYVGVDSAASPDQQVLFALDIESGEKRWSFAIDTEEGREVASSPAVVDGRVYFAAEEPPDRVQDDELDRNALYALDAATGEVVWIHELEGLNLRDISPAVADGTVFAVTGDSDQRPVRLGGGGDIGTGTPTPSTERPDADGESVPGGEVYAVTAADGSREWEHQATGGIRSSPAVVDGILYIGHGGSVTALDVATGRSRWTVQCTTDGQIRSSPAVADGRLYIGGPEGTLYAIAGVSETGAGGTVDAP